MAKVILEEIGGPREQVLSDEVFRSQQVRMDRLAADLAAEREAVRAGWGDKYHERVHAKGKLTSWERVERLRDPGTAILPIGTLVNHGRTFDGRTSPGAGVLTALVQVHGLWTKDVQAIHALLPAASRDLPWSIATLGELAAAGIVDAALVTAVKESSAMRSRFVEAAGLLSRGQTVRRVRQLADEGALESAFAVRAPRDAGPDWDVAEVLVRPGQAVAAGQTIAVM